MEYNQCILNKQVIISHMTSALDQISLFIPLIYNITTSSHTNNLGYENGFTKRRSKKELHLSRSNHNSLHT